MTYDITTQKGYDGWEATSEAILEELSQGTRILKLRTSKSRGGLAASATVSIRSQSNGFQCETTEIFGDFSKHNIAPTPCKRVTEKAVLEVHQRALQEMDELIEQAQAFYREKNQADQAASA